MSLDAVHARTIYGIIVWCKVQKYIKALPAFAPTSFVETPKAFRARSFFNRMHPHTHPPALKISFLSKSLLIPQMSFYRVFFFKWASSENVSKLIGCWLLSTGVYHEQANIGQIQYRVCQNCRRVVIWLLKTLSKRAVIQQKRFQRAEWPVWGEGEEK